MRRGTVLGFLCLVNVVFAEVPPAATVQIKDFRYSGSGCRDGSVGALLSPDNQAVTLLFDNYVVDSSESPSPISMKNCNINFYLSAPEGWEYAVISIDYRGYADLQEGVKGYHSSQYGFGHLARRVRLGAMELEGPYADDYTRTVVLPLTERSWSACNRNRKPVLKLSTQLTVTRKLRDLVRDRVRNRAIRGEASPVRPEGLMTLDSLDGHVTENYGIQWRRCEPQKPTRGNGRGARRRG